MEGNSTMSRRGFFKMVAAVLIGMALAVFGAVGSPGEAHAALTTGKLQAQSASTLKCYTVGTANTPVYSSANLTSRTGAVYSSDEVRINSFSSNKAAVNVTYPTARGSKSGWIRTNAILSATGGYSYNSKGRFTTYRRPGGASYGAVYAGDQVVVLGRSGSWTQIRYPVSGGYKFAWAYTSTVTANTTGSGGGGNNNNNNSNNNAAASFRMPVSNYYVCGNNWATYSAKCGGYNRHTHCGVDIKSRTGDTTVYAAAAGTVAGAGYNSANGNYVVVKHTISGKTVYSFYAHLKSRKVGSGTRVSAGTPIGVIGNTGSSSMGVHLHFAFASAYKPGSYYGYVSSFSGNKTTYSGVTYYNPVYVVNNGRLP